MMKRTIKYLVIVFFMLVSFKAQAYALKLELNAPEEIDEGNLEKTGLIAANKNIQEIVRPNVEYKAQGLRNPFEQPTTDGESEDDSSRIKKEVEPPKLIVQGIIWGGNFPQAIVNNKVVKVGDVLEGVDIVGINKEGVTVLFAGVEHKLTTLPAMGQQENLGK